MIVRAYATRAGIALVQREPRARCGWRRVAWVVDWDAAEAALRLLGAYA